MTACPKNLAATRQNSGVSLEQIAESTKISMRFLLAIEAAEFGKLPGGIFATSYLRQYAAAAGVDETSLLAAYSEFVSRTEGPALTPAGMTGGSRRFLERWFRTPAQSAMRP